MEWSWTRPKTRPIRPTFTHSFLKAVEDGLVHIQTGRKKIEYVIKNDMPAVVLKKRVSVLVE